MAKIKAEDAGTWLDGRFGWTNGYRCVERAVSWGWKIPEEYAEAWAAFEANHGDHDLWCDANGDDGGFVDAATDYLQGVAPDGYVFRWDAGELSLTPAWVDCASDGGGCEVSGWGMSENEHVTPCQDHKPDYKIRVVPNAMCPEYSIYAVMLWDEGGEVMSGYSDVTFTPPLAFGLTGEFWFPELIMEPRIRRAAEKLIKATRCEGHADDDAALTSGVGIGESVKCDGSCQD